MLSIAGLVRTSAAVVFVLCLSAATADAAQAGAPGTRTLRGGVEVIFIVRHAERQTGQGDDSLSAAGRERAARLAAMLRDAGLTDVLTSNMRRTAETAEPVSRAGNLVSVAIALPDAAAGVDPARRQVELTVQAVNALSDTARVLVVGHSNTVPLLLEALGVPDAVTIADTEFDNLFVLWPQAAGPPVMTRLRY